MILDIDPKVDYAFKHMLGREVNRSILIDVIDIVLDTDPAHRIIDIELLDPFNPTETPDDKLSILAIKARDQSGRQFNIEMQMLTFQAYEKRILYYGSKLHQQQLHEGQDYFELMPTISISFLGHVLFPDVSSYHLRFRLLEESLHFPLTDDIEFHLLELPKFKKSLTELTSELDIWLYFLRHAAKMEIDPLPEQLRRPVILRAVEDLKVLKQSDVERERYEARRKVQLDFNTGMKAARLEGEKVGLEKGEKVGLEKGKMIGAIHLCEGLLGRPETATSQLAGLSLEELSRLADELQALVTK